VVGKIVGMKNILKRYGRRGKSKPKSGAIKLAAYKIMAESQNSIDGLMGVEGVATAEYFACLRDCMVVHLGFTERNRRPPRDPVNALLSFGYTILYRFVHSAENCGTRSIFGCFTLSKG